MARWSRRRRFAGAPNWARCFEKLEVHAFVGSLHPGEERAAACPSTHDAVRKRVVYGFVSSDFGAASPRALHQRLSGGVIMKNR